MSRELFNANSIYDATRKTISIFMPRIHWPKASLPQRSGRRPGTAYSLTGCTTLPKTTMASPGPSIFFRSFLFSCNTFHLLYGTTTTAILKRLPGPLKATSSSMPTNGRGWMMKIMKPLTWPSSGRLPTGKTIPVIRWLPWISFTTKKAETYRL